MDSIEFIIGSAGSYVAKVDGYTLEYDPMTQGVFWWRCEYPSRGTMSGFAKNVEEAKAAVIEAMNNHKAMSDGQGDGA